MDKSQTAPKRSAYQEDLQSTAGLSEEQISGQYVMENGNRIRVPYRMVREVIFTNVKHTGEFADAEHAARLQYRLMLNDAILKARVFFIRNKIAVIYNPKDATNLKEKIDIEEIKMFLREQGVEIDEGSISDQPYDYYKDLYTYAFMPPAIREHAPYGYTLKEWKRMKPEWNRKSIEYKAKKEAKQEKFRQEYLLEHPELAKELGIEIKDDKKRKRQGADKGFWFHGV